LRPSEGVEDISEERMRMMPLTLPEGEVADELMKAEIENYLDRLIYATAVGNDIYLLTGDARLRRIAMERASKAERCILLERYRGETRKHLNLEGKVFILHRLFTLTQRLEGVLKVHRFLRPPARGESEVGYCFI
jgi:hypothetical protein